MQTNRSVIVICCLLILSCSEKPSSPVTIGLNPWPGYEFLFLAEQKGFFQDEGINVRLAQMSTFTDVERAYFNDRIEGMTGTIVNAVKVSHVGTKPLKIVLIPNYSNGGDVIIADKSIGDLTDLKGKRVGCELGGLGLYVLHKALLNVGLTLADVTLVNTDQVTGGDLMFSDKIDAFVSHPPTSVDVLKHDRFHAIFSSAEIPFEIIDTVIVSDAALIENPNLVEGLHNAWQKALDFTKLYPEEAYRIMAEREGISSEEFQAVLSSLVVVDKIGQRELFRNAEKIQEAAKDVCNTLLDVNLLRGSCDSFPNIVYRNEIW